MEGLHNKARGLLLVHYYDRDDRVGRKYILSNAHVRKMKKPSKAQISAYHDYKALFVCLFLRSDTPPSFFIHCCLIFGMSLGPICLQLCSFLFISYNHLSTYIKNKQSELISISTEYPKSTCVVCYYLIRKQSLTLTMSSCGDISKKDKKCNTGKLGKSEWDWRRDMGWLSNIRWCSVIFLAVIDACGMHNASLRTSSRPDEVSKVNCFAIISTVYR